MGDRLAHAVDLVRREWKFGVAECGAQQPRGPRYPEALLHCCMWIQQFFSMTTKSIPSDGRVNRAVLEKP